MKRRIRSLLLAAAILSSLLAGCGKTGGQNNTVDHPTEFDEQQGVEALLDYAARLEELENREAAAAVYTFVGKVAQKELENSVQTTLEEDHLQELQFLAEMVQGIKER